MTFIEKWNELKVKQASCRQNIARCDNQERCETAMAKGELRWCCKNGDEFDKLARDFFKELEPETDGA